MSPSCSDRTEIRMNNALFHGDLVNTSRILYTPSDFAKLSLFHLQEIGSLQATKPHTSKRDNLCSYLFFIVGSGSGYLRYENIEYPLTEGDCVFIDCRHAYSHTTFEDLWSLSWIHFDGPTAANVYQKYKERGGLPAFRPDKLAEYQDLFYKLYEVASSNAFTKDMEINAHISFLLSLLMKDSWHPDEAQAGTKKKNMVEIKQYLDEHFDEKIALDQLAQRYYINKYYLTRAFKEQFGLSIMDYLLSIRITKAKALLRFTSLSAEEIGQSCGIGDVYYFSRVFKKVEGISIREYRKQWH